MIARDLVTPYSSYPPSLEQVRVDITIGDCLRVLRYMQPNSIDCVVTSPPYYFLRDYGNDQQIGMETSPVEFVDKLTEVFREVRRVLRSTGTLWLNIGDNYCTRRAIRPDGKRSVAKGGESPSWADSAKAGRTITGRQFRELQIKEKDLFLVPHDLAASLRTDGWYLRSTIHWFKSTVVPEKQRDAPSDVVEYVFLFSKEQSGYVYNNHVLREQGANGKGRPHRNVWELGPSTFQSEHTATMPEELAGRCILTGTNRGAVVLDPFGGAGTTAAVAVGLGRHCKLIELNADYSEIARKRVHSANCMADCHVTTFDEVTAILPDEEVKQKKRDCTNPSLTQDGTAG